MALANGIAGGKWEIKYCENPGLDAYRHASHIRDVATLVWRLYFPVVVST